MSRDGMSLLEAIETVRKRTNEKGVGIALTDILRHAGSAQFVDAKPVFETTSKVLVQGVLSSSGGYEKLKSPSNIASAVRTLSFTAQGCVIEFPKALGASFFKDFLSLTTDDDVKFALLELFIKVRIFWRGSYEVLNWLKVAGCGDVMLAGCKALNAKPHGSIISDESAMTCAHALELYACDISANAPYTPLFEFNLIEFAKNFLSLPVNSKQTWRTQKQKMCSAMANIIVIWKKLNSLPDASLFEAEEELAKLVVSRIKDDLPALGHLAGGELPVAELKFLRNWCYNSRRLARLFVQLGADEAVIALLTSTKFKDVNLTRAACGLLRNLARKQVKIHQSLIERDLVKTLKEVLRMHPADTIIVSSVLGCMLNMTSSAAGRTNLSPMQDGLVGEVLPKHLEHPEVVEMALGVLWGLCTRNNLRSEEKTIEWYTVIVQATEKRSEHVGCLRRGLGALIMMLMVNPETKKILLSKCASFVNSLSGLKEKQRGNLLIACDIDLLIMLLK